MPALDPFAFVVRRSQLAKLPTSLPLAKVPRYLAQQGHTLAVALDTYVHRSSEVYEWARPDLLAQVSLSAVNILDVGCASGVFGRSLKERQHCRMVGIEINPRLADIASKSLDHVICTNVETLDANAFSEEFDSIICGDVLEHLRDPWAFMGKLSGWLRPQGQFITTIPNVGQWAIVKDLIEGRWDVIPFGHLCWGHLRFFTRKGVEQLLSGHPLTLEKLEGLKDAMSPVGEEFLAKAAPIFPEIDGESLRTNEFLMIARKR